MTQFRRRLPLTALCLVVMTAGCNDPSGPARAPQPITSLPRTLSTGEQAVISASNTFAFGLLQKLNTTRTDSNIFMSPLSASMALGMTMNGAAGRTFDEMRSTLGFPDMPLSEINTSYQALIALLRGLDPRVDFRIANAIWYEQGFPFEQAFLNTTKQYFDARVTGLDFRNPTSITTINSWVSQSTNGKIPKMIEHIDADAVMFLMNAIYFKGDWTQQFDRSRTRDGQFTKLDGTTMTAKMMEREGAIRRGFTADATVIDLPYGGGAYSMTILLPNGGKSVNDLVAQLDVARWNALIANLQETSQTLIMPKFRLSWEAILNNALIALGMHDAFGDADFSRMSRAGGLYIHEVKQKSYVDVYEEGTEAAAVTSVEIRVVSLPAAIVIDRPFLFAIRERLSGTILFVGKIVRPEVATN